MWHLWAHFLFELLFCRLFHFYRQREIKLRIAFKVITFSPFQVSENFVRCFESEKNYLREKEMSSAGWKMNFPSLEVKFVDDAICQQSSELWHFYFLCILFADRPNPIWIRTVISTSISERRHCRHRTPHRSKFFILDQRQVHRRACLGDELH